jgi:hypothetical protein
MPKTKAMALKPPTITRLQGKSSFRMGAPPAPGKPVTAGKCVAVGGTDVGGVVGVVVSVVVIGVVVGVVLIGVVVGVSVSVVVVGVVVGVVVACVAQIGPVMVLESNVTWPVCTRARPFKLALVFMVMSVSAKIFPMSEVFESRVAELPILHHTLQGSPPVTDEPGDVMSVDTVLKIQTPDPTRVRFPVSEKLLVEQ